MNFKRFPIFGEGQNFDGLTFALQTIASEVATYLVLQCHKADSHALPAFLRELESIAGNYPEVVQNFVPDILSITESGSSSLKAIAGRIRDICRFISNS